MMLVCIPTLLDPSTIIRLDLNTTIRRKHPDILTRREHSNITTSRVDLNTTTRRKDLNTNIRPVDLVENMHPNNKRTMKTTRGCVHLHLHKIPPLNTFMYTYSHVFNFWIVFPPPPSSSAQPSRRPLAPRRKRDVQVRRSVFFLFQVLPCWLARVSCSVVLCI